MNKKENQSKAGNHSLLQTARTKNFCAGKFALLSLKSKPQLSVRKVKVPVYPTKHDARTTDKLLNDVSKVSEITTTSNEERNVTKHPTGTQDGHRNAKSNFNDDDVESSVLGLSIDSMSYSEFSLSKAYTQRATEDDIPRSRYNMGKKQNAVQHTTFSSLWPAQTGKVDVNSQQYHSRSEDKSFSQSPKPKTMDISKGLRFTAPSPMTLNRYQPQMGQEKTAPESKEYLKMQAHRKMQEQKQIEAKHLADAQFFVQQRLKEAFQSEDMDVGFVNENKNSVGKPIKKKFLIKKILGKVRPQPSQKWHKNHEKSSAIQAAMSAAAAAVEAATGNHSSLEDDDKGPISEEEARAIVNQALAVSRRERKTNPKSELSAFMFHPSKINDRQKMRMHEIISSVDEFGRQIHFPVNEVMMKPNEDSVSDLDASIRNLRKLPLAEIHMKDTEQCHGDYSVSTLGTPRVFEQLDKLLLSEPHRFQQSSLIDDFLEDNMGGSAAPPPMVTSHDARALIDQLDSGTMAGDTTTGTLRAENAVQFCNIASNCFHPDHGNVFVDLSAHSRRFGEYGSAHEEESNEGSEESSQRNTLNNEIWSSPNPTFTQAIDYAIRKAEGQISTNYTGYRKEDEGAKLSFVEEVGELLASPFGSEVAVRESKSRSTSPRTISTPSLMELASQSDQQKSNFGSFMKTAASKLDTITESDKQSRQGQHKQDNEILQRPREQKKIDRLGLKDNISGRPSEQDFSHHQFDLPPSEKSGRMKNDIFQLQRYRQLSEDDGKNASRRKKSNEKDLKRLHAPLGHIMNQKRYLLEKDDEYWDTLSTIASTANDRSLESDTYFDKMIHSGPIPGEITTASSEMKSVTASIETGSFNPVISAGFSGESESEPNQRSLRQSTSPSEGKLNEMINDVTDLIDADLLDKLPTSKTKRPIDPLEPDVIDRTMLIAQNRAKIMTSRNQKRPSPETVEISKVEESKSGSLSIAASQITRGIRSVSWGIEEIYEDKNSHLDISEDEQDTKKSEISRGVSQKAPSLQPPFVHMGEDEDLLSRTLELSKGLLETILGSQIVKNKSEKEEEYSSEKDSREMQYDTDHRTADTTSIDCRDDFHHAGTQDLSPMIHSRIESLRNQRSRALSKFRQSQKTDSVERDRERFKYHPVRPDFKMHSTRENDHESSTDYQQDSIKESHGADSALELRYTTSDSNDSSTPSQRARDLRMQLDEAMRASREIRISQNELGNELNSFNKKYYSCMQMYVS